MLTNIGLKDPPAYGKPITLKKYYDHSAGFEDLAAISSSPTRSTCTASSDSETARSGPHLSAGVYPRIRTTPLRSPGYIFQACFLANPSISMYKTTSLPTREDNDHVRSALSRKFEASYVQWL